MTIFKRGIVSRLGFMIWSVVLTCTCSVLVEAQCTGNNVADDENYRVRNVTVNALFGRVPGTLKDILAKHRNELYRTADDSFAIGAPGTGSESNVAKYGREVLNFFEKDNTFKKDSSFGVNQHDGLYLRATFSSTCVKIVPVPECEKSVIDDAGQPASKCVDIEIKIRVIPVNTANPSSNLLDLARSNQVRFYRELPRALLALDPTFGIEHDNTYGPSVVGSISTDLLSLPSILKGAPKTVQKTQLQFAFNGRKSLKTGFYNADSTLSLSRSRPLKLFEKLSVGAGFTADRETKGDGILTKNVGSIAVATMIRSTRGPIDQIRLGADYRWTNNRFSSPTSILERTREKSFAANILTDGRVGRGFVRAGLWFDRTSPTATPGSYSRAAAMVGYSRNFVLPGKACQIERDGDIEVCVFPDKNPDVIGVEGILGIGKAWGDVPQYARFYGGNSGGNFLYDAPDKPSLARVPDGPLIRSFGRNKAGSNTTGTGDIRGGTSYSHFNLTVSLPVKAWSRPLIPAVSINDRGSKSIPLLCSACASLKDVLKNQVDKGKNIYIDAIASRSLTEAQREDLALVPEEGLTPEEEERLRKADKAFEDARVKVIPEADEVWRKLTPTVAYIADNANLYSVKPLVMFDAARIAAAGESGSRTRLGLGGGLQINVVVAKFELGYVRTIRRVAGDGAGNFVVRMVFEKLF